MAIEPGLLSPTDAAELNEALAMLRALWWLQATAPLTFTRGVDGSTLTVNLSSLQSQPISGVTIPVTGDTTIKVSDSVNLTIVGGSSSSVTLASLNLTIGGDTINVPTGTTATLAGGGTVSIANLTINLDSTAPLTVAGALTTTSSSTATIGGLLTMGTSTVALTTNTNNLTLSTKTPDQYFTSTGAYDLTGIDSSNIPAGAVFTLYNGSTSTITLPNNSGSSTAGNRFKTADGNSLLWGPGRTVQITLDNSAGTNRWDITGGTAAAQPANVTQLTYEADIDATEGYYYTAGARTGGGSASVAFGPDLILAFPFRVDRSTQVDRLAVNVFNAVGVGQKLRLGIYGSTSPTDLRPGALLVDGGELSVTATGLFSDTIALSLVPGNLYWCAVTQNAGAAGNTYRGVAAADATPILGSDSTFTTPGLGWSVSQSYGALPDPFPLSGIVPYTAAFPAIGLRFSS